MSRESPKLLHKSSSNLHRSYGPYIAFGVTVVICVTGGVQLSAKFCLPQRTFKFSFSNATPNWLLFSPWKYGVGIGFTDDKAIACDIIDCVSNHWASLVVCSLVAATKSFAQKERQLQLFRASREMCQSASGWIQKKWTSENEFW